MSSIPNTVLRQFFLIILILVLGGIIFINLSYFLPAFLGAYTLYILLKRPYVFLRNRWNWSGPLTSGVLILISIAVIIFPLNSVLHLLSSKILPQLNNSSAIWSSIEQFIRDLEFRYNIKILTEENILPARDYLIKESSHLLGATLNSLGMVAISYFLLYFLLTQGASLESRIRNWLPLSPENMDYFGSHMNGLVYSNAVGVPLVALAQSLVAGIGYWIAGVGDPFLWVIVSFFASFIPFLGAMIVYIPLSIMLIYSGSQGMGIFLILYGFIIVGSVDNIFRMMILKRLGNMHPLITIFGVFIGLKLFGFLGLIFGPILISIFLLFLDVYLKEYSTSADSEVAEKTIH